MTKDEITKEFEKLGCGYIDSQCGGVWATDNYGRVFAWTEPKIANWQFARKGRFRVKAITQ